MKVLHICGILFLLVVLISCERRDFEEQPAVETGEVSEIAAKRASCDGTIIDLGSGIEDYGHCWSTTAQPTTSDNTESLGRTTYIKTYTSELEDLEPGVTYYVRAFVSSEEDTYYGEEVSFTTLNGLAEVSTSDVIEISLFTAKCGGNVLSAGGDDVTARGVCWDSTDLFSLSESVGLTSDSLGIGSFESELSGLIPEKVYYVKSYAITSVGTTYGEINSFSTLGGLETIVTTEVKDVTATSVTCGGIIGEEWGATITARGVCWSTSQNPNIADQKTNNGTGTGSFISPITGLNPGTTYYVRAYATNSEGPYYGPQQSFTTLGGSVTLTTTSVSGITTKSAISGGNITDDGGVQITERGVCWSTSHNPTIDDYKTNNGSGTGSFTSYITGLNPGTTYYVRAYAINSEGTEYGDEKSFTTEGLIDYDGNVYQTVQIGSQMWMAENLKTTHYANGSAIPYVESTSEWGNLGYSERAYCWYDNSTSNRDIYGGLYTWATAMNRAGSSNSNPSYVQGVCPDGWHLPSDSEWKQLEMHLGMSQSEADIEGWRGTDEGGKLKETGTSHWISPNNGATNSSGFTALPGGHRYYDGSFRRIGYGAGFWTATEHNSSLGWRRHLHTNDVGIDRDNYEKDIGRSVRCVKD